MTVLQLINNLAMTIIIGIMVMATTMLIIRTIGEERRHSTEAAEKSCDRMFDRFMKGIKDCYKEIKEDIEKSNNKHVGPRLYREDE